MTSVPSRIVVDTNVWLDFYLTARPGYQSARNALLAAHERGVELLYAATTAKDVYYLTSMSLKQDTRHATGTLTQGDALAIAEMSWGFVGNLCEMATAVGVDNADVWLALKYRRVHRDFEDNLVVAAAQRAKADLVLTTDEALMRHSPVACLAPADLCALLDALDPLEEPRG